MLRLFWISIISFSLPTFAQVLPRQESPPAKAELHKSSVWHTLKIEDQQVWLDGKQQTLEKLPVSLHSIPQGYSLSLQIGGTQQFRFSVLQNDYQVMEQKIIEVPRLNASNTNKEQVIKSYYSDLKQKDPEGFELLEEEAELEQKSQKLAIEYNSTPDKQQKGEIEQKLKSVLEELFELKIKNTERELVRLQGSVDELRKKLSERKKNKSAIIDKRVQLLIKKETEEVW